jgi:hypothetical protein
MFLQHSIPVTSDLSTASANATDFDLIINSKSKDLVKGEIRFTYLKQSFEAQIQITPSTIQVVLQYPFEGIIASAPLLPTDQIQDGSYLNNGTLSKNGYQNIIWLQLDLIHLYNLIRFKPNALVDLYRESIAYAKKENHTIVYGQIPQEGPIAKIAANALAKKMKRKHKYVYGNSLNLLSNIQQIITSYPPHFLAPQHLLQTQASLFPGKAHFL